MKMIFVGASNPETIRMITAVKGVLPRFEVIGFLDNDPQKAGKSFFGFPIIGGFEMLPHVVNPAVRFVNLITRDCVIRYDTSREVAQAGGLFTNFIHPSVNLEMVELGVGNYVQESVVLQAAVRMGNNSSVHMGALIGHETHIGSSVFVAHGCNISGLVRIEDGVFLGTGASVVPRVTIGRWSIIGAGAVITKDVPPYSVVVGNPGRIIKSVDTQHVSGDILV